MRPKTRRRPYEAHRGKRGAGRPSHSEQGAALVEFAFVLPLLLVLLFGIVDFGLYIYNDLWMTHAARDAVRAAAVETTDQTGVATTVAQKDVLHGDPLIGVIPSPPTVTVRFGDALRTSPAANSGESVTVTIRGQYSFLTPLLGKLMRFFGANTMGNSMAVASSATMRHE